MQLSGQGAGGSTSTDWRLHLSIEDRQRVRKLIRDGYRAHSSTREELVELVGSIQEELVHAAALSRLDYFKAGFEFDKRVKAKAAQLRECGAAVGTSVVAAVVNAPTPVGTGTVAPAGEGEDNPTTAAKRQRCEK